MVYMNPNTFPTKGNLIIAKNSLALAKQGYELMDKKRNILIRELMELISPDSFFVLYCFIIITDSKFLIIFFIFLYILLYFLVFPCILII